MVDSGRFAEGADHFVVVGVADQDDRIVLTGKANRFQMDLGDQRAGGVDHLKMTLLGLFANRWGNAMGAEDDTRALRHLAQFIHEDRARLAQLIHYVAVVDNLLAHVNRRSIEV